MRIDTAIRLAAGGQQDITAAQVQVIISDFLAQVRRCPVCDDTGKFTFGRDITIPEMIDDRSQEPVHPGNRVVPARTSTACPLCGGPDEDGGQMAGDPAHMAWHCTEGDRAAECREARKRGEAFHAECGYRVILPVHLPPERRPMEGGEAER